MSQTKRSQWKNQFKKIGSSSRLHEQIRVIFSEDPYFKSLSCYQEVPVSALVPSYNDNSHRIDWFIDELFTVLEIHGSQHYKMANFGGIPFGEAQGNFHQGKVRDNVKKQALLDEGYEYREISYKLMNKMNAEMLKQIIFGDD